MSRVRAALMAAVAVLATVAMPATAQASAGDQQGRAATGAVDTGLLKLLSPRIPGVAEAGGNLYLNGRLHYFTGINAYNATTDWSVNWGCGSMIYNLDDLFGAVPQGSLIRTWAFQGLGYNSHTTHRIDFTAIDRVVAAAQAHHDYLILTMSDQGGTCDDWHFHDAAWYAGGYRNTYNDDGHGLATSMSYLQWVKTVVKRYRNNRTVAIYEPVNEPEASNCNVGFVGGSCYGNNWCPANATSVLRSFFDKIGSVIKGLDPRALISSGTIGGSQCGIAGNGFRRINASKYVDITTLHDYGYPTTAATSGLLARAAVAKALGKAFIVEESGIDASPTGVGCMTLAQRAEAFKAKALAAKRARGDGFLPWYFDTNASTGCSQQIAPDDPVLAALN